MIVSFALVNAAATLLMIFLSVGISSASLQLLAWMDARLGLRTVKRLRSLQK